MNDRVNEVTPTDGPKPSGGTGSGAPERSLREALPVQTHVDPARSPEERDFVDVNTQRQAFDANAGDGPRFDDLVYDKHQLQLAGVKQARALTEAVRENDDAKICGALVTEAQLQLEVTRVGSQQETAMRQNARPEQNGSPESGPYREVSLPDSADSALDPLLPDLTSHQGAEAIQHLATAYQAAKERAGARAGTGPEPTITAAAEEVADAYRQIVLGKEQSVNPGREEAWKLVAGLLEEQTANPPTGLGERVRPLLNRLQDGLDEAYEGQRSAS